MADMGVATMNDMRDNATMIANVDPSVPLIADADTGYGGESSPESDLSEVMGLTKGRRNHGRPHRPGLHPRRRRGPSH